MENKLLLTFALAIAIVGTLIARSLSGRLLGSKIEWGPSGVIAVGSLIAGIGAMIGFSSNAPDSTFFTLLPFIVYFAVAAILTKLFAKDTSDRPGIAESLLFGFVLTVGTTLAMLSLVLVGIIVTYLVR